MACFGGGKINLSADDKLRFFVITTIFNPVKFSKRYDLYHKFARHMSETGGQLITIECIFPSLNQNEFQVTNSQNPFHIQIKSNSIYWMKENLINIAVSKLPSHAKWVCWLDADTEFTSKDWIHLAVKELKKYIVVQLFKKAEFLGPYPEKRVLRTDYSFGYSIINNKPIDQSRYDEWYPHPGYGWAMRIEHFKAIGGLPDYDIVGSGDLHFAFSLLNRVSLALENDLHIEFKKHVISTSERVYSKLQQIAISEKSKSMVGYVPVNIKHFWHGSRKNRQYVDRWKILIAHQFNLPTHTIRLADGLFEFIPNVSEGLQEDILAHFAMRNEDCEEIDISDTAKLTNKNKHRRGSEELYSKGLSECIITHDVIFPLQPHDPDNPQPPCPPCDPDHGDNGCPCPPDYECPVPCPPNHDAAESNYSNDYGGSITCHSNY